jgi:hypothetical protein
LSILYSVTETKPRQIIEAWIGLAASCLSSSCYLNHYRGILIFRAKSADISFLRTLESTKVARSYITTSATRFPFILQTSGTRSNRFINAIGCKITEAGKPERFSNSKTRDGAGQVFIADRPVNTCGKEAAV